MNIKDKIEIVNDIVNAILLDNEMLNNSAYQKIVEASNLLFQAQELCE